MMEPNNVDLKPNKQGSHSLLKTRNKLSSKNKFKTQDSEQERNSKKNCDVDDLFSPVSCSFTRRSRFEKKILEITIDSGQDDTSQESHSNKDDLLENYESLALSRQSEVTVAESFMPLLQEAESCENKEIITPITHERLSVSEFHGKSCDSIGELLLEKNVENSLYTNDISLQECEKEYVNGRECAVRCSKRRRDSNDCVKIKNNELLEKVECSNSDNSIQPVSKVCSSTNDCNSLVWDQNTIKSVSNVCDVTSNSSRSACENEINNSNIPLCNNSSPCGDRTNKSCDNVCGGENDETREHFTCPLCFKILNSNEKQLMHTKACATRHNITTRQLLNAVELQKRQIAERKALGLPGVPTAQQVKKSVSRKTVNSGNDPNLQLALALSASIQEAEEHVQLQNDECLIEAGLGDEVVERQTTMLERFGFTSSRPSFPVTTNPKSSKNKNYVPPLMSRTKEDRERLVTEKVAIILMEDENKSHSVTDSSSNSETNHSIIDVTPKLHKYQSKTHMLWDMVSFADLEKEGDSYYVSDLSKFISPCKVKAGDKLKHLSQIPGRNETPEKTHAAPILQESYSPGLRDQEPRLKTTAAKDKGIKLKQSISYSAPHGVLADENVGKDKNSIAETLISDWKSILNKKIMSDLTIHVEKDIEIPAHKLVLYVRCKAILNDVVSEMPLENCKRVSDMLLWIDVSHKAALAFLQFLYCGLSSKILHLDEEDFLRVRRLAQRYRVTELLEHLKVVSSVRGRLSKKKDMSPKSSSQEWTPHKNVRRRKNTSSQKYSSTVPSPEQMIMKETTVSRNLSAEFLENGSCSTQTVSPNNSQFQKSKELKFCRNVSPDLFLDNMEQTDECHDLEKLSQENKSNMDLLLHMIENPSQTQSVSQTKNAVKFSIASTSKNYSHPSPRVQKSKELSFEVTNCKESDSCTNSLNNLHKSQHLQLESNLICEENYGTEDTVMSKISPTCTEISTPVKNKSTPEKSPFSEISTPVKIKSKSTPEKSPTFSEIPTPVKNKSKSTPEKSPTFSEISTPVKNKSTPKKSPKFSEISTPMKNKSLTFSEISTPVKDESLEDILCADTENAETITFDVHNEPGELIRETSINSESSFNRFDFLESLISDSTKTESGNRDEETMDLKRRHSGNDSANDDCNFSNKKVCREKVGDEIFQLSSEKILPIDELDTSRILDDEVEVLDLTQTSSESDLTQNSIKAKEDGLECYSSKNIAEEVPESITRSKRKITSENGNTVEIKHCSSEEHTVIREKKKDEKSDKIYRNNDWDEYDEMCSAAEPQIFSQCLSDLISTKKSLTVRSPSKVENNRLLAPAQKSPLKKRSSSQSFSYKRSKNDKLNKVSNCREKSSNIQRSSALEPGLEDSLLAYLNESILWRDENAPAMNSSLGEVAQTNCDNDTNVRTPTQNQKGCRYSEQVTPPANYSAMKTPQLKKELRKFGLKPSLTKKQAKKMLRYIYDQLHPYITASESDDAVEDSEEGSSVFKKPESGIHIPKSPTKRLSASPAKKNTRDTCTLSDKGKQTDFKSDAESESDELSSQESSSSGAVGVIEELMCEDICSQSDIPLSQNASSDHLPSVVHNFITSDPEIYQKVLLYEPIWLEELHSSLKANNFKFKIDQLMDYLDEQCITFRSSQGQRNRQKKKQKRDAKKQNASRKKKRKGNVIGSKSTSSSPANSSYSSN
ncbi:structure-specific endonuclease subunit SLX4-like isoform X2 [Periplaneta americana]|uniref:structure-specific endonuclease subunit SLX4-like isoform X2 n=1 Tax=Periplaneta americana TaxID=6978 RepID=UPI0037E8CD09